MYIYFEKYGAERAKMHLAGTWIFCQPNRYEKDQIILEICP